MTVIALKPTKQAAEQSTTLCRNCVHNEQPWGWCAGNFEPVTKEVDDRFLVTKCSGHRKQPADRAA